MDIIVIGSGFGGLTATIRIYILRVPELTLVQVYQE